MQGLFDISVYGVKSKSTSLKSYEARPDKVFFERLSTKLDESESYKLMIYNFVGNPECLSYELSGTDAYQYYLTKCGVIDRMLHVYKEDLEYIFSLLKKKNKKFKDLLTGDGHPVIIQLLMRNKIQIETLLIIDSFLPVIESMNESFHEDILFQKWYTKLTQYKKLTVINNQLAKEVFIDTRANFI